jgi:glutamyl-tRNA synthetase
MGAKPATYAHLSLLMGPDGKKLSKRHGDTAMSAYKAAGYMPEAMNNYLALLGWSAGEEDDDIASLDEMVSRFDLSTVSKNPAIFDTKKLEWMNGVYVRAMGDEDFADLTRPDLETALDRSLTEDEEQRFAAILPLVKERTKLLPEAAPQALFLFTSIDEYDEASWSKVMETPEAPIALDGAAVALGELDEWTTETIDVALRGMLDLNEMSARKGLQPIRVAISGSTVSPPLFESIEILGKDETLSRIAAARSVLDVS